ncbi:hypothetical protein MBLNU13_g05238t2 [Cladosporium sp. NU13]
MSQTAVSHVKSCAPFARRTSSGPPQCPSATKAARNSKEVMRHPYFHKHVTHFVWDASEFDEETANNDGEYSETYLEDPHLKRYAVTPSHMVRSNRDDRIEYVKCHKEDPGNWERNALLRSRSGFDAPIDEAHVADYSMKKRLGISGDTMGFYKIRSYHGKKQYAAYFHTQEQLSNSGSPSVQVAGTFIALELSGIGLSCRKLCRPVPTTVRRHGLSKVFRTRTCRRFSALSS